ncbi:MAG: T9SS type A sorting domain-containing protein [Bacteroidetes bacterium]|nr:T9SS type A sorting domain-containing protein [Bacteroidota bacterium]
MLELGLHYTQTGAPRASVSNAWQSYFANNWMGTITNGKNLNHSDCNGDGIINDNDTLAIYNNYGLTHAFKPAQTNTVNPQLRIVPDQAAVAKGSWGSASIYLGDTSAAVNSVNGVAFTIDFNTALIQSSNIYIEYQNSFLDPSNQNLDFRKLNLPSGKIFTATTHTVNNNVSGNGLIAKLHYQIKSSLTTDQVLNLGISQANQSDALGTIVPLTSGSGTLMALGTSVGLQELNGNVVSISPNPTNGLLTINSKTELQKIDVISITGALLLSETPTNVSHTLHLDNFSNGIYFVNIYQYDRIVKREKIVLNK